MCDSPSVSPAPRHLTAHLLPLRVPAVELLCFGLALDHGVGRLQVGGVGHQGQGDVPVGDAVDPPVVHPQVVFDVTGALAEGWGGSLRCNAELLAEVWRSSQHHGLQVAKGMEWRRTHLVGSLQLGVELAEDLLQLLPDHVGKDIQPPPVKAMLPLVSSRQHSPVPPPPESQGAAPRPLSCGEQGEGTSGGDGVPSCNTRFVPAGMGTPSAPSLPQRGQIPPSHCNPAQTKLLLPKAQSRLCSAIPISSPQSPSVHSEGAAEVRARLLTLLNQTPGHQTRQHTPVGHSHDHIINSLLTRLINDGL